MSENYFLPSSSDDGLLPAKNKPEDAVYLGNEVEWGTTVLKVWGWLTLVAALIASIILMTYTSDFCDSWFEDCTFTESHPFFFSGLLLGLFGLFQAVIIFGVQSYMKAQRVFAKNLGRALERINNRLDLPAYNKSDQNSDPKNSIITHPGKNENDYPPASGDDLERLKKLRDKGILSDEEFKVKRQEILDASTKDDE